jgi:hypothetical protein
MFTRVCAYCLVRILILLINMFSLFILIFYFYYIFFMWQIFYFIFEVCIFIYRSHLFNLLLCVPYNNLVSTYIYQITNLLTEYKIPRCE